jgi:hypothetical protein
MNSQPVSRVPRVPVEWSVPREYSERPGVPFLDEFASITNRPEYPTEYRREYPSEYP